MWPGARSARSTHKRGYGMNSRITRFLSTRPSPLRAYPCHSNLRAPDFALKSGKNRTYRPDKSLKLNYTQYIPDSATPVKQKTELSDVTHFRQDSSKYTQRRPKNAVPLSTCALLLPTLAESPASDRPRNLFLRFALVRLQTDRNLVWVVCPALIGHLPPCPAPSSKLA